MSSPMRFSRHDRAAIAVLAVVLCAFFVSMWLLHRPTLAAGTAVGEEDTIASSAGAAASSTGAATSVAASSTSPSATSASSAARGLSSVLAPTPEQIEEVRRFKIAAGDTFRHRPYYNKRKSRFSYKERGAYSRARRGCDSATHIYNNASAARQFPRDGRVTKLRDGETVDLNCGDTAVLQRVPGVGSVLSRRIVSYGRLLGGYVSPAQVSEVYGMSAEFERWFTVSAPVVNKLNLNTATFAQLLRHPYLDKRQVQAIFRRRELVGKISSLDQLTLDDAFTPADLHRLAPYVDF